MYVPAADRILTVEEYEALPDNEYFIEELSRGRLVREPRPGDEHGAIVPRIVRLIGRYLDQHPEIAVLRSESGFLLSMEPATVRGPDVAIILRQNLPVAKPRSFFVGAPDLAIEVVSPGNAASDMQQKILEFLEAGTSTVWVVYPGTRTVVEHSRDGGIRLMQEGDPITSELLPDFSVLVAEFFRDSF